MPTLIVERGREKGQTFELANGSTVVVGRDPQSAQIVIADAAASRRHFQLSAKSGRWYCADLGSKNFTFVNEEKVEKEVELTTGDRVQVGETVFTFNDDQKAEDKAAGLTGKEIGGYRILERIGRGGMGTVFKAKQISLNRLVALKFLSPKLSKDPGFVEKFFAEARAAAQLNHPNVVQVFDVGTLQGVHFFSMEFMEGGCVQDILTAREDSRLPWQEALPLIIDSVRGLVFAEKRGIVHRDIKPDNLMLTSEQKVKIGDLGLATHEEGTKEKGIFGTPHFIAPEQAQGKEVTHAADLYALGGTIYRIVCGRTPFSGTTVKEILRAQINEPHVPVVQVVPGFPPELSAIVDRLMAKKVEDRYQSATRLLEDLEAFQLAHQIEMAGGVKSRKPFLIAVGILLVALAAVVAYIAMKEPDIRDVERFRTVEVPVGTPGPSQTPEQIQAQIDQSAQVAFQSIQVKDIRLGEISREKKEEWLAIAKEYDSLRDDHPKSPTWCDKAEARAKEIRIRLDELETEYINVIQAAESWWTKVSDELKGLIGLDAWGRAVRRAAELVESDDFKKHKAHCPADAETWLRHVPDECYDAATKSNAQILIEAQKLFDADDVQAALKKVEEWEKKLREQNLPDPRWPLLADQAKDWRESRSDQAQERLRAALASDKVVFADAWRKVRSWPRDASTTGGPLWAYHFRQGATDLRAACEGRLKTWLYKDRAETTARRIEEAQAAFDAFAKLVAEKKLWAAGEEIKDLPGIAKGTKASIDPEKPATADELYILCSISGGSTRRTYQWDDFEPEDLYRIFIRPKADRIPAELTLGLAKVFALLGAREATGELLDASKDPIELKAWVMEEWRAMQAYDTVLRAVNMDPTTQKRAVGTWRKAWYRTEFYFLADGRPSEEMNPCFAEEDIERFVESFGARPK